MLSIETANSRSMVRAALAERKRADHMISRASESGFFEGYASLFGVLDTGGDIVAPGAFARSLRKRGAAGVKLLWQHKSDEPIGVWTTIEEDARGLKVTGKLDLSVARAREALSLMRSGALDGLSIGFRATRSMTDKSSGARKLLEVDLWEISIVTFPMLTQARVSKVKRAPVSINDLMAKLARLKYSRSAEALEAKLAGLALLEHRYAPDQPRAPAGSPQGGQWMSGGGADVNAANGVSVAGTVVNICVAEGIFRSVDEFGNRSYKAIYGCRGGQTITREGFGDAPGLILDPFQ